MGNAHEQGPGRHRAADPAATTIITTISITSISMTSITINSRNRDNNSNTSNTSSNQNSCNINNRKTEQLADANLEAMDRNLRKA